VNAHRIFIENREVWKSKRYLIRGRLTFYSKGDYNIRVIITTIREHQASWYQYFANLSGQHSIQSTGPLKGYHIRMRWDPGLGCWLTRLSVSIRKEDALIAGCQINTGFRCQWVGSSHTVLGIQRESLAAVWCFVLVKPGGCWHVKCVSHIDFDWEAPCVHLLLKSAVGFCLIFVRWPGVVWRLVNLPPQSDEHSLRKANANAHPNLYCIYI